MGTIYEDVEALKEQMTQAQNDILALQGEVSAPTALTENTNLNDLGVGTYYIPTVAVSATISNKPVSTTSNAAIIVLNGAADGELQQWYFINTKNTTHNNKIYHRYYYDNAWSEWQTGYLKDDDSGWLDLPLASGVTEHNASNFPCRYRKIGNRVWIEGCVKGFSEVEKVVATIPAGFRPSKPFYMQNATNGGNVDTFNVQATSGQIQRVSTTLSNVAADNYHFINMSYLVD